MLLGPQPRQDTVTADIVSLADSNAEGWLVKWIPRRLGVYTIDIWYGGTPVACSPFRCKVHDPEKVIVRQEGLGYESIATSSSEDEVSFYG